LSGIAPFLVGAGQVRHAEAEGLLAESSIDELVDLVATVREGAHRNMLHQLDPGVGQGTTGDVGARRQSDQVHTEPCVKQLRREVRIEQRAAVPERQDQRCPARLPHEADLRGGLLGHGGDLDRWPVPPQRHGMNRMGEAVEITSGLAGEQQWS
jgi:hypothetical protein